MSDEPTGMTGQRTKMQRRSESVQHVLVVEMGPEDGVCTCTDGGPHLHLESLDDVRESMLTAQVRRVVRDEMANVTMASKDWWEGIRLSPEERGG